MHNRQRFRFFFLLLWFYFFVIFVFFRFFCSWLIHFNAQIALLYIIATKVITQWWDWWFFFFGVEAITDRMYSRTEFFFPAMLKSMSGMNLHLFYVRNRKKLSRTIRKHFEHLLRNVFRHLISITRAFHSIASERCGNRTIIFRIYTHFFFYVHTLHTVEAFTF